MFSRGHLPFPRRTLKVNKEQTPDDMSHSVAPRAPAARSFAPVTHYLRSAPGAAKRLVPGARGRLEVMRIQRVDIRTLDETTTITLNGVPASANSGLRAVMLVFQAAAAALMPATFDASAGSLRLHYPAAEMSTVMKILTTRKRRLCYHWRTEDGTSDLSWLFAV